MCLGANWILIVPLCSFPFSIPTTSTSGCTPLQGTSNWASGSMCSSNTVLPYRLLHLSFIHLCVKSYWRPFSPAGFSICPPQPDTQRRSSISDSSMFLYFITNAPPSRSLLCFPLSLRFSPPRKLIVLYLDSALAFVVCVLCIWWCISMSLPSF